MEIKIEKATQKYIADCADALLNSELGIRYFSEAGRGESALSRALQAGALYAAFAGGSCVGFIWYDAYGAFSGFPFIHMIAVKDEYRNKGIGTELMCFAESIAFESSSKLFLLVGDFNPNAKRLYEKLGFRQVGEIPGLYREGITEIIMMKEK